MIATPSVCSATHRASQGHEGSKGLSLETSTKGATQYGPSTSAKLISAPPRVTGTSQALSGKARCLSSQHSP
ncbi:hypothetical protein Mterra_03380 [Calidithermus terrae]|uniref:Uncharacterized protein n=1 Tax=Calidithermus terrae TaxID=1408545 RepID=A0A399E8R0_9DEIN|nr:hypothetical protein Mterra_03380 [Calidithermus terrae]